MCLTDLSSARVSTPIGLVTLSACAAGVCGIKLLGGCQTPGDGLPDQGNGHLMQAVAWINSYFDGGTPSPEPHACLSGCSKLLLSFDECDHENGSIGEFQKRVYDALRQVKFGETVTYAKLSKLALGHERASRAVGSAMKRNPLPLLIPCHRVINSSGHLGSYSMGGSDVKRLLIAHETRSSQQDT